MRTEMRPNVRGPGSRTFGFNRRSVAVPQHLRTQYLKKNIFHTMRRGQTYLISTVVFASIVPKVFDVWPVRTTFSTTPPTR